MIVSYVKKPDEKFDELTEFKRHYRTSHIQTAKVILDLKEKKVIKNGLNPQATFEDMIEFYKRMIGDRLIPHLPKD
jgi:hypothetical protein